MKIKFSQKFIVTDLGSENTGVDGFCLSWVNAAVPEKSAGILHPIIDLAKSGSVPNC